MIVLSTRERISRVRRRIKQFMAWLKERGWRVLEAIADWANDEKGRR